MREIAGYEQKKDILLLLASLKNEDGATLKNYKPYTQNIGYAVGMYGKQTKRVNEAADFIMEMKGNAGLWLKDGMYYIDKSVILTDKDKAIKLGRICDQMAIFDFSSNECLYL